MEIMGFVNICLKIQARIISNFDILVPLFDKFNLRELKGSHKVKYFTHCEGINFGIINAKYI